MERLLRPFIFLLFTTAALVSCMDYGALDEEEFTPTGQGVFITNEGNFMYGNASLSYYLPSQKKVENEVFIRANGINLGDVAQSMVIRDGRGYIVVNKSGIIFVIDIHTFKVLGSITGLNSPRYIHFVSDTKAYVTDLYAPVITVIDPQSLQVTGQIDTRGHASTEQMVQYGKYVFTHCWSYDNALLVIDTEQDQVVDQIEVGIQPVSMKIDRYNKIWVLTDGGYEGSPSGWGTPALYRIDAATRVVEREFPFDTGDSPSEIALNGARDTLYFINKSIWRMDVKDERMPIRPFVRPPSGDNTIFYGLGVDPATSEVYVADAIDYSQPGIIYRYSPQGEELDAFRVGIIPGAFCFK